MLDFNENIVYFIFLFIHCIGSPPSYFFIGFDDKAFVYDKIVSYYLLFTCDTQEKQTKNKNYFNSKFIFCNRFSTGS